MNVSEITSYINQDLVVMQNFHHFLFYRNAQSQRASKRKPSLSLNKSGVHINSQKSNALPSLDKQLSQNNN